MLRTVIGLSAVRTERDPGAALALLTQKVTPGGLRDPALVEEVTEALQCALEAVAAVEEDRYSLRHDGHREHVASPRRIEANLMLLDEHTTAAYVVLSTPEPTQ